MQRLLVGMIVIVGVALTAGPAGAQITYEFADTSGVPQTNFVINGIGGTVQVRIYLHETTPGASELNSQGGLLSTAVRLTYNNPGGFAAVQSLSDVVGANPPWSNFTTTGSNLTSSAVINDLNFSGVLPDADGRILIGTFTLHGLAGGTENLMAIDPNPGNNLDTTHITTGVGIDSSITFGSASLVVNPVPEPAAGVAVAAALFGLYRRVSSRWRTTG